MSLGLYEVVSQHLRVLREVGLVEVRPEGPLRIYVRRTAERHHIPEDDAGPSAGTARRMA